uniref:Cell wall integrity protein scw1 n=1 Tax=Zea mays TaxID=4577 RepID=B6TSF8_MAIZE|nr:cell wall integrity protein scw1 [Zea mays]ACG40658.1 cell wall integrity protein scw1 [Zea mays]
MAGAGIHPFQQWPPAAAAPPPPGAAASVAVPPPPPVPGAPGTVGPDEVRTIFITGLPADVKERELHNLLRWLPGFEASQINFKGDQPMGFALFSTAHQAIAAKTALQDMVFDAETKVALHTEMAKKNLFVKRCVGIDANAVDQSKRLRTGGDYTHSPYAPPFHPPPPAVSMWGTPGYITAPPPYNPYAAYPVPPVAMTSPAPVTGPTAYAPVQNTKDNPPCNTLFIGNLGDTVVEEELRSLFSVQPGFKQMKVLRQDRNTVCFIEFEDVNAATSVHQTLQGAVIPSSGRGGMRIQFSKNPFGRRKDSAAGLASVLNGAPAN